MKFFGCLLQVYKERLKLGYGYIGGLPWREADEKTFIIALKMFLITNLDPNLLLYSHTDNSTKPLGNAHVYMGWKHDLTSWKWYWD